MSPGREAAGATLVGRTAPPGGAVFTRTGRQPQSPGLPDGEGHFAPLDGLRGIAVLLVLARHASVFPAPGDGAARLLHEVMRAGWIGVDLFFALSGFLITGILLDTRGRPGALRSFYARRSLRIFPLYFAVLAVLFLVFPLTPLGDTAAFATLRENAVWFWTYTVNILVPLKGEGTTPFHLVHLWSLSVEEQFYLFWPLVVLVTPLRRLGSVCLVLAGAAVALRAGIVLANGWGNDFAYMLMPARMDALLLGAFLAILRRRPVGRWQLESWYRPLGAAALGIVLGLAVWRGGLNRVDPYVQVVGYFALSVGSVALIAATLMESPPRRFLQLLSTRTLRFIGKLSYAIYVFHHPMIGMIRYALHQPALAFTTRWTTTTLELTVLVVATVLSTALAWVSWTLLERPFLMLKRHFPREGRAVA